MYKGYQDNFRSGQFKGYPNLNHQMNTEAYGFVGWRNWLDAAVGSSTVVNNAAVTSWTDRISGQVWVGINSPVYILNDANFNNYPSIALNTVNKIFTNQSGIGLNTRFTLVLAVRKLATNTGHQRLLTNGSGATTANGSILIKGIGIEGAVNSGIDDTSSKIIIITNSNLMVNGVVTNTYSYNPALSYTSIGSAVGSSSNALSSYAEILNGDMELTATEMLDLSTKLNSKFLAY